MLDRATAYIRRKLFSSFYLELNHDPKNTILLAGSARSGTSWLAELINYRYKYRYMFEPFHAEKVEQASVFLNKRYLPPDNDKNRFTVPLENILTGRVANPWIDQYNRSYFPKKRLIKTVRSNLLLPWINQYFSQIPKVFVVRHPLAVAVSRERMGWDSYIDLYLDDQQIVNDLLNPYKSRIEAVEDPFEKQVILWCVENWYPLARMNPDSLSVIYYENICLDPRKQIPHLFDMIDEPFDERVFSKVREPSALSTKESAIKTGENLIKSWQGSVSDEQIESAWKWIERFNLSHLYQKNGFPTSGEVQFIHE